MSKSLLQKLINSEKINTKKIIKNTAEASNLQQTLPSTFEEAIELEKQKEAEDTLHDDLEISEKAIIQCLLHYGNIVIEEELESMSEEGQKEIHTVQLTVADYIIFELERDRLGFANPLYKEIYDHYLHHLSTENSIPNLHHFTSNPNTIISSTSINLALDENKLSQNWEKFGILIPDVKDNMHHVIKHNIWHFKQVHLNKLIQILQNKLNDIKDDTELFNELSELKSLKELQIFINKGLGRTIVR